MVDQEVARHVDNFFLSADPPGSFVRIAERIAEIAERDEAARDALKEVVLWLRGSHLDSETRARFRRIHGGKPDAFDPPEGWSTLIPVGYLRALAQLRAAVKPRSLDDILSRVPKAREMLPVIESALGETLLEAESRRSRDDDFARRLQEAREEVTNLLPKLVTVTDRLHAVLDVGPKPVDTARPGTQAVAARRNQGFECCIDCVPTDCAIVVVVIVIIVVVSTL